MKFLFFQHVPNEHPGYIMEWAKQKQVDLTIIELWKPYILPSPNNFDALVVLGGPMGVYENFPSMADEISFIQSMSKINKPVLGFCLGAQLLAKALGADVYKNEKNGHPVKEVGYYDLALTAFGLEDPLFQGFASPIKVLQWHGDTFDLPETAILLATSDDCKNQAFKCQKNYGLQFHMEFTPDMVEKQIMQDREWIHKDFGIDEEQLNEQSRLTEVVMRQQCALLMDNFLKIF